jgi:hypothetical protein
MAARYTLARTYAKRPLTLAGALSRFGTPLTTHLDTEKELPE